MHSCLFPFVQSLIILFSAFCFQCNCLFDYFAKCVSRLCLCIILLRVIISMAELVSVAVQADLNLALSEAPKIGFVVPRPIFQRMLILLDI